jgi:hypothetical protein
LSTKIRKIMRHKMHPPDSRIHCYGVTLSSCTTWHVFTSYSFLIQLVMCHGTPYLFITSHTLFLFKESKAFSKSKNIRQMFVTYLCCSMIICFSDYPHLYCLDPMLGGPLVTTAWRILRMQMEKTASSSEVGHGDNLSLYK